ncbi:GNAT family N-acetyltransferase [Actinophytocola sp. NPDC049390]|uniref:GNAT family N-acetyltransferase n=1 Tax=Actinophytocola sp. NPDC049390 TaxID=3363894 RepID=UPI0037BCAF52
MVDKNASRDTLALEVLTAAHGPVMSRLWQLYWHDLSEYREVPPRADGTFKEFDMPSFLGAEPGRSGFLLWRGDDLAGFVLVGPADDDSDRDIREFFVVRGLRRHGVGRRAAAMVLAQLPGRWMIAFQEENPGAAAFWRRVAADAATDGVVEEPHPVPNKPWLPPDVVLRLTTSH